MFQDRGAMLTGFGIGVGVMYLLDPTGGRRRRALLRDQFAHATSVTTDAAEATGRDLANRSTGAAARLRGAVRRGPVDDLILMERVRARLGHVTSHPGALDVEASDGVVTLRGPILEAEAGRVRRGVRRVRGVRDVIDEMTVHSDADGIPALQGIGSPPQPFWRRGWSPTARLLMTLVATATVGLLARAATFDTATLEGLSASTPLGQHPRVAEEH